MQTLAGVWGKTDKLYLSRNDAAFGLASQRTEATFKFDDHELVNDIWGCRRSGQATIAGTVFRDIEPTVGTTTRLGPTRMESKHRFAFFASSIDRRQCFVIGILEYQFKIAA